MDCETVAATAAVDAANVSASADVDEGAGVGVCVGADAAKRDGKNFDPAAVAPFSFHPALEVVFCILLARFTWNEFN